MLLTSGALREQAGSGWRRVDGVPSIEDAWALPDGATLLVTQAGDALVRDAKGGLARASWPLDTIEGRKFAVKIDDAICTRDAGCWAVAGHGMGLYHDRAPGAVLDLSKLTDATP
jgi:hypothetical protein